MKLELRKLLQMLGVLQPDPVFYIGGSDVLPQPLAPAQEQALLRELAAGSESLQCLSGLALIHSLLFRKRSQPDGRRVVASGRAFDAARERSGLRGLEEGGADSASLSSDLSGRLELHCRAVHSVHRLKPGKSQKAASLVHVLRQPLRRSLLFLARPALRCFTAVRLPVRAAAAAL